MTDMELINKAICAMNQSYSPYSEFCVGAALISKNGKVYTGTNIENAAFSATVCAERTAFFKAVSEGEKEFSKIAIVGGKKGDIKDFCFPCGVCRQVMSEFCEDDFSILTYNGNEIKRISLKDLLPLGFGGADLC